MNADDLKRGSLNEFGGRRMTSVIEARLDRALAFAVNAGCIVAGPGGILPAQTSLGPFPEIAATRARSIAASTAGRLDAQVTVLGRCPVERYEQGWPLWRSLYRAGSRSSAPARLGSMSPTRGHVPTPVSSEVIDTLTCVIEPH